MRAAVRAAAALAALVLVVIALGVVSGRGSGDGHGDGDGDGAPTATPPSVPTSAPPPPAARPPVSVTVPSADAPATLGPVVRLAPADDDASTFPATYDAIGGLVPGTVLQVRVAGFDGPRRARAKQCLGAAASRRCGNSIPVQFGEDGTAAFQYLVGTDFLEERDAARCRIGGPRCFLVVEDVDGDERAEVQTVFHDTLPPPGRVSVTPDDALVDGAILTITLSGYPPVSTAQVLLCAAPATAGTDRCSPLGEGDTVSVGPDGTASTTVAVAARRVGTEGVRCGRGRTCGISVVSSALAVPSPVARIGFAAPPGADYHGGRLAVGLALAALLLGVALRLVRRTDWRSLGEEAAPEIDEAAYADLDAIVAALPPEDDHDHELSSAGRR